MRATTKASTISRLAGAVAALWLCGAGAAWAGGGADLGSLQALIGPPNGSSGACKILGMGSASLAPLGPTSKPCPQLPTVTQAILELAALGNSLSEMARAQNAIPPGSSVNAGNAAAVPPAPNTGMPFPLDSTTSPPLFKAADPISNPLPGLLTTLTPLAFISQSSGTAQATQLYDSKADAFLYAVGVSTSVGNGFVKNNLTDPDTVYFFYEDLFRTNQNFNNGQIVANFSLPLTVLDSTGGEHAVPITLQFRANSAGDCKDSTVVGNFPGVTATSLMASQIGIDCAVRFSASPISTQPHAIFEVAVRLLVTGVCNHNVDPTCPPNPNTDPAYFYSRLTNDTNPINALVYTAFNFDDRGGNTDPSAWPAGALIGLAPTAAPLGPAPAAGVLSPFALCATLPVNTNGNGAQLRPAVGAYYAMATSGEMLLSAALPSFSASFCPLLP